MYRYHQSLHGGRLIHRVTLLSFFAGLFLLESCGGKPGSFSVSFPDNNGGDIETLTARIQGAKEREIRPCAVGVTPEPSKLYAFDLNSQRVLWQAPTETSITPIVVGDYVITHEKGDIVGHAIESGDTRFRVDDMNMTLVGADASNRFVAFTLTKGSNTYAESAVFTIRANSVLWKREFEGKVGSPAVIGDVIIVPWNHQNLSAIDATTGDEFARIRLKDTVVGHAFVDGKKLFAGSNRAFFEITPKVTSGLARKSPFFELPERNLPGEPLLLPDVYSLDPIQPPESASHRIALKWRPSVVSVLDKERIALQDNNLYLVFYRFIVAFDPSTYAVRWIYTHPEDMVGTAVQTGGILFADVSGHFGFLSANKGEQLWKAKSGLNSLVVTLRPERVSQFSFSDERLTPEELRKQLLIAARDSDARLVPVRVLIVELLAALDDPESTANLIELCDNDETTAQVRKAACDALANRKVGSDQIVNALKRHASFLDGTTAPPVGALAMAAAKQKNKSAVALLVAHLKDPNTPVKELPKLVWSLGQLQDHAAVKPLTDFLRLYHADANDPHLIEALVASVEALVALSGPASADVLKEVSNDVMGSEAVREQATAALERMEQQRLAAEQEAKANQKEQQAEAEQAQEEATEKKPEMPKRLSHEVVSEVLLPVRDELKLCLRKSSKRIFSARVLIVVDQGKTLMVSVMPNSVQSCIEPLVRSQQFPVTEVFGKENVAYTIKLR